MQCCAGGSTHGFSRGKCVYLFPSSHSMMLYWGLERSQGGSIYTTKIGKLLKIRAFDPDSELLNIYGHTTIDHKST